MVEPDRRRGHEVIAQPVVKGDQLPEVGLGRRCSGVAIPLNPWLIQISFAYGLEHLLIDAQLNEMDSLGFFLAL
jgi:hypothetical protein